MKLWWNKIKLFSVGIEPIPLLVASRCTNHNTFKLFFDGEVFSSGTILRLTLVQYPS